MDNAGEAKRLTEGAARLGIEVPASVAEAQLTYAAELLRWNAKVNLTAITEWDAVVEKHLIDSLTVMPYLVQATHVLDLGAGAGLPGVPLALALPKLEVTLVDAVAKKVGFIKHVTAKLGISNRVHAVHARVSGAPDSEKLPRVDVVMSRAFMDVGPWLKLAVAYVKPGGRVLAMLGRGVGLETELTTQAEASGLKLQSLKHLALPFSGDPRSIAEFSA